MGSTAERLLPPLPPGPAASAFLQMLRLGRGPLDFLDDCARRYGDCFTVRLLGKPPLVIFSDPEAIKAIFTGDPDQLHAGKANMHLAPLLGQNSLLMLDGARHLRERRLMLPPFHGERMQVYGRTMREITDREIDSWPLAAPFPIHPRMQGITLDIILGTVFGLHEGAELVQLRSRLVRLLAQADSPLAAFLIIPWLQIDLGSFTPWGSFVRKMRDVDAILFAKIAERRAAGSDGRPDVLSMLVEARDEDGNPMSDQELRDEMLTLLMAGHETTATSLAWVFQHVLARPDVHEKLRAELRRVVGSGPVEPHHIPQLDYLDAVIKETARLSPVLSFVSRWLEVPMRIGGHDLPAGVIATPCFYLTHRRADLWPNPERFEPERFIGARPSPYEFFPFGGGVRRCIGAAFAGYEMKVVLAEVLSRVELRAVPGYQARPVSRTITVAPSAGMPVVVVARAP